MMHLICKPIFKGWKLNEKVTTDDKMTCREIRRNSFGCVKLKDECEKCQKIQHIGECNVDIALNYPTGNIK